MTYRLVAILALCLASVIGLGACVSAGQRFEQGQELERSGQRSAASQRYLQALRKDAAHIESRQRLTRLAPQVLSDHLAQADNDQRRGDAKAAANALIAADRLIIATRSVGITLDVPGHYAKTRAQIMRAALQQSIQQAQVASAKQQWSEAMAIYKALKRYEPSLAQVKTINLAQTNTLYHWAEAEYAAGHFHAALERVEQALQTPAATSSPQLQVLREQILDDGTQRVVFLPLRRGHSTSIGEQDHDRDLARSINRSLEALHWSNPPVLIEALSGANIRYALRRHGGHRTLDRHQAIRIGRQLQADIVVIGQIDEVNYSRHRSSVKKRSAKRRGGGKAVYRVEHGRITEELVASYQIISLDRTQADVRGNVRAQDSRAFDEAKYKGDVKELSLSRKQRALFSKPSHDDHTLAGKVAARFAQKVLQRLQRD